MKKAFENKRPPLASRQEKCSQNLLIRVQFDVIQRLIAPAKNIGLYNSKKKGAFYTAAIILTDAKNLILNLNLAVAIFGNTTFIFTVKAEM